MAINTTTSVDVQTLTPFKKFIMTIGNIPTSYLESMSYAELLMWFCNYLQNTVIPTVNNNAEAIQDLINYINNYFDNLDVQEEINNKLDEMAENGTLYDIIKRYTDPLFQEFENNYNNELIELNTNLSTGITQNSNAINQANTRIDALSTRVNSFTQLDEGSTTGDAELIDGRIGFNGTKYNNIGDSIRNQIGLYYSTIHSVKGNNFPGLELGNISMATSGFTYSNSTTRVRSIEGTYTKLKVNDKLGLKDYVNYEYYVGWQNTDNNWKYNGWRNADFTVTEEGNYYFLIRKKPESNITDISDIVNQLFVISNQNIENTISTMQDDIEMNNQYLKPFTLYVDWAIGRISELSYNINANDCLRSNNYLFFRKYDHISCPVDKNFMLIYCDYPEDGKGTGHSEWIKDYTFTEDKICRIMYKHVSSQTYTDTSLSSTITINCKRYNQETYFDLFKPVGLKLIAHMGNTSDGSVGNTLPAFINAGKQGFWGIETDLSSTVDGYLVCQHDLNVANNTDGTGNITELYYSYVSTLTINGTENTRIPLFEDYLKVCRKYNCIPVIEIKNVVGYTTIDAMVTALQKYNFVNRCIIIGMAQKYVEYAKFLLSNNPVLFVDDQIRNNLVNNFINKNIGYDLSQSATSTSFINQLHENDLPIGSWTINDNTNINLLADDGVDMITTDMPLNSIIL